MLRSQYLIGSYQSIGFSILYASVFCLLQILFCVCGFCWFHFCRISPPSNNFSHLTWKHTSNMFGMVFVINLCVAKMAEWGSLFTRFTNISREIREYTSHKISHEQGDNGSSTAIVNHTRCTVFLLHFFFSSFRSLIDNILCDGVRVCVCVCVDTKSGVQFISYVSWSRFRLNVQAGNSFLTISTAAASCRMDSN